MLAAVGGLGAAVTTSAAVVRLDAALGELARVAASHVSHDAEVLVSALGATDFVLPATAASAAILLLLRHWRGAVTVVLAVLCTQAVVDLIKLTVSRPRPALNEAVSHASGFSFPSAHSATSMAFYATVTFLAARACRGPLRVAVGVLGAAMVVSIGLSRVFLAAHYPIDVLGGWLTGAAIVVASWLLARRILAAIRPSAAAA